MDYIYNEIKKYGKVKANESLAKHCSFKVGGIAKYFISVNNIKFLEELLKFLDAEGIKYIIIGGGTNLLFSDNDFEGVVIFNACNAKEISVEDPEVLIVESGCLNSEIAQFALKNSLSGFEWGIGVPGTIGGAVRGNAGLPEAEIKDSLQKVLVYENGEILEYDSAACVFSYRNSIFKKNKAIILQAWLKLKKTDGSVIQKKTFDLLSKRTNSQPQGFPTAGCTFKNVSIDFFSEEVLDLIPQNFVESGKVPAGWLIDSCGLKDFTVGGAKVSDKHANFILNFSSAKAIDILNLIEQIKEKVYNKYKVLLEEEIQLINF
ncbi:MAG: UDP-N-acetylmuramate dehydrogenase [Patescibacteria group bacterium]